MAADLLAKRACLYARIALVAALGLALSLGAVPDAGAQGNVDLQLVLAVDVSGSVSEARFELQKRG